MARGGATGLIKVKGGMADLGLAVVAWALGWAFYTRGVSELRLQGERQWGLGGKGWGQSELEAKPQVDTRGVSGGGSALEAQAGPHRLPGALPNDDGPCVALPPPDRCPIDAREAGLGGREEGGAIVQGWQFDSHIETLPWDSPRRPAFSTPPSLLHHAPGV